MTTPVVGGQVVQTAFGKGVVREVRNNGRLLVDVAGRALVVETSSVSAIAPPKSRTRRSAPLPDTAAAASPSPRGAAREIDLHGLTVAEALSRVDGALDEAMRADFAEVRFIHGRTGGRLRAALHRRLADIPSVRSFAVDPRNHGVTVVHL